MSKKVFVMYLCRSTINKNELFCVYETLCDHTFALFSTFSFKQNNSFLFFSGAELLALSCNFGFLSSNQFVGLSQNGKDIYFSISLFENHMEELCEREL
jgi:predicted ester cyclase